MEHLTDAIKSSLESKNWFSAIALTLTIPDICAKITDGNKSSGEKYADWFNDFVGAKYITNYTQERLDFFKEKAPDVYEELKHQTKLSGNDCYALRCAFLHEGESEILNQRAQEILDEIQFVEPNSQLIVHGTIINKKLILHIDTFANDIIEGVRQWKSTLNADQIASLDKLAKVKTVFNFEKK
tara:strand:+ start:80 stop:631 length:552 start_codon:yes stop_codon:yes gene_type:complete